MYYKTLIASFTLLLTLNLTSRAEDFRLEKDGLVYIAPQEYKNAVEKAVEQFPNIKTQLPKMINEAIGNAFSKQCKEAFTAAILVIAHLENPDADQNTLNKLMTTKYNRHKIKMEQISKLRKAVISAGHNLKYIKFQPKTELSETELANGMFMKDETIQVNYNFDPNHIETMNTIYIPLRLTAAQAAAVNKKALMIEFSETINFGIKAFMQELMTIKMDRLVPDVNAFFDRYFQKNNILSDDDFLRRGLTRACTIPSVLTKNKQHNQKALEVYMFNFNLSDFPILKANLNRFDLNQPFPPSEEGYTMLNNFRDYIIMLVFQSILVKETDGKKKADVATLGKIIQSLNKEFGTGWKRKQFINAYNSTFKTDFEELFKTTAQNVATDKMRTVLRALGTFTEDDPIKVTPRSMRSINEKIVMKYPTGMPEEQLKQMTALALEMHTHLVNIKRASTFKPWGNLEKSYIKEISSLEISDKLLTKTSSNIKRMQKQAKLHHKLLDDNERLTVGVWYYNDLKTRLKAGQKIDMLKYNPVKDSVGLNFDFNLNFPSMTSKTLKDHHFSIQQLPFVILDDHSFEESLKKNRKTVEGLNKLGVTTNKKMMATLIAAFNSMLVKEAVLNQVTKSYDVPWFVEGLSMFTALKTYAESYGIDQSIEVINSLYEIKTVYKLKHSVDLLNWGTDGKEISKDQVKVNTFYAIKCFTEINEKYGDDFIKGWIKQIQQNKTPKLADKLSITFSTLTGDSLEKLIKKVNP